MMFKSIILLKIFFSIILVGNLGGAKSIPDLKNEILKVVDVFFGGLSSGDSTKIRSIFHSAATLTTVLEKEEKSKLKTKSFTDLSVKP